MDEDIVAMILLFIAGMTAIFCTTAVILSGLRRRPQKLAEPDLRLVLSDISERLSRLDGSIETMAVEVERISEAQRFTARVLSERQGAPALPDNKRGTITPH